MKRRRLLGATGGLLAGSLTVGTGAFSSTRAERSVTAKVVDDSQAYLRIDTDVGIAGRSSDVNLGDGARVATFRIPGPEDDLVAGTDPSGIGNRSQYWFDNMAIIQNQGTNSVVVYSDYSGELDDIAIYKSGQQSAILQSEDTGIVLDPGDSFTMGLYIKTADEGEKEYNENIGIIAKAVSE